MHVYMHVCPFLNSYTAIPLGTLANAKTSILHGIMQPYFLAIRHSKQGCMPLHGFW